MFTYTADQLKDWKKKYGDDSVFEVVAEDKKAILHKPTRKELSYARAGSQQGQGRDIIKFCELLLKQCWIDGDMEIQENDIYFFGVMPILESMIESKEAEIKKL